MNRVVITGVGIWSCIGQNIDEVSASLRAGRSGIGVDPARLEYGYRSGLTGIVPRPALKGLLDRRLRTGLSEEAEYAYMAAAEAFDMAGVDKEYRDTHEIGILFGNDSSAQPVIEAARIMEEKHDSALLGSGFIFRSMNSTVNMNLSTIFALRGINFTISAACASGSHSIGIGYMLIRQGLQQMVLCGGAQETNHYSMATFDALSAFSVRMDDPHAASRPFDRSRDGLVPSGGAAALVLESYDSAVARGANILAEVTGYGFSSNGGGISQPGADGSAIAMQRALDDAGVTAAQVDYVNAHATSTVQGDRTEAEALTRLFGGSDTLISSTKSMTGHECWMAGASEAVYCVAMMRDGFVAPNINLVEPDEAAATLNIPVTAVNRRPDIVLSNSFGFGGTNSAIVLRRPVSM